MCYKGFSASLPSRKTRFALRFIGALRRIKMATPTTSSLENLQNRGRMIKFAVDTSMASVVGSKRCWSRAMLLKIHNRARIHAFARENKKKNRKKRKKRDIGHEEGAELCRTDELRQLVPGGNAMDICSLLEETANYIKCLNTQVKVMQGIVDIYSS